MKTYFKLLQEEIYHAYKSSKLIGHSLPTGNEREIITSRFLARHMPPFVEINQGVLVDQSTTDFSKLNQKTSPQLDLILAMNHHPNLTFYGGTKFLFAESIAAVIEVKSKLTTFQSSSEKSTSELDKIMKHCGKVKQLNRQILGFYFGKGGPSKKVPYYVIAFESDNKAGELIKSLQIRSEKQGFDDKQRLLYQPDGIFILDPNNSAVVLKHITDHEIRPETFNDSCFASGNYPDGEVLVYLWLTLFQQIENIRFLKFPYLSYAKKSLNIRE